MIRVVFIFIETFCFGVKIGYCSFTLTVTKCDVFSPANLCVSDMNMKNRKSVSVSVKEPVMNKLQ